MAPETLGAVVPAMSVQPLVENAVRHGIERRAGTGRVAVQARVVGEDIELRVSDDGSGIEPDRLPGLLAGAGGGIGLANVDGRLRATFGERYALRLESELGRGHDGDHDRAQPGRRGRPADGPAGRGSVTVAAAG